MTKFFLIFPLLFATASFAAEEFIYREFSNADILHEALESSFKKKLPKYPLVAEYNMSGISMKILDQAQLCGFTAGESYSFDGASLSSARVGSKGASDDRFYLLGYQGENLMRQHEAVLGKAEWAHGNTIRVDENGVNTVIARKEVPTGDKNKKKYLVLIESRIPRSSPLNPMIVSKVRCAKAKTWKEKIFTEKSNPEGTELGATAK